MARRNFRQFTVKLMLSGFLCAVFMIVIAPAYSEAMNLTDFTKNMTHWLGKELIAVDSLPFSAKVDAVYVLGGSQNSLEYKFKTVADYYHKGICKEILILSRPGITEYSSLLARNLTNNEWTILKLKKLGISGKNIETVDIGKGFFGTLTEAKSVSGLIKKRGYKTLMLITSPYHTKRVKVSFTSMLTDTEITLCVRGSAEQASLSALIVEFIKLKIYKYFLI
ncbi:MAG: ElyC/SanA/YdcF family protein [Candidatus Theseobacter exili]|nr:ElyC/SanA/YdcF family protein [Candidatus Theseobacter exili]